jgi:radical SAM protein with 4Fe4S-binding SPASM domain
MKETRIMTKKASNLALYRKARTANSANCANRPLYLLVEVTSKCNLSCRMCNMHHHDKSGITIDDALLETTFQLAETAFSVGPYGLGEPLLHPRIAKIIGRYKASGSTVSITTNGMLMNEKISESLIASGLDHLAVSIDAADPILFSRIRRGADLKRIAGHITTLNRLKKLRQSKTPTLSLNAVVQAGNIHQLPGIIELAEQWEVPFVTLSPITVHKHIAEIQNEVLGPGFTEGKAIIERCYKEAESRGVAIETERLNYVLNGSRWETLYKGITPCPEPFRFMVIRSNGDIFPCCNWDVNKPISSVPRAKGVSVNDLEKAWHDAKWESLRKKIILNDYPEECKTCMANFTRPFHDENLTI